MPACSSSCTRGFTHLFSRVTVEAEDLDECLLKLRKGSGIQTYLFSRVTVEAEDLVHIMCFLEGLALRLSEAKKV